MLNHLGVNVSFRLSFGLGMLWVCVGTGCTTWFFDRIEDSSSGGTGGSSTGSVSGSTPTTAQDVGTDSVVAEMSGSGGLTASDSQQSSTSSTNDSADSSNPNPTVVSEGETVTSGATTSTGDPSVGMEEDGPGMDPVGDPVPDCSPESSTHVIIDGDVNNCVSRSFVRFVFVTSEVFAGDLGEYDHPDKICDDFAQKSPNNRRLSGLFKAWIDPIEDMEEPDVNNNPYFYVKYDPTEIDKPGKVIINNNVLKVSAGLKLPLERRINVTESAALLYDIEAGHAWTGIWSDGTPTGLNCQNWSDVLEHYGTVGSVSDINKWADDGDSYCAFLHRIYCIQQGPI